MLFYKFLERLRVNECLKYCKGKILDIGCGHNNLVKRYENGTGVDVYPWEGADIVCDTTSLPFGPEEFERVFLIATLNHIPEKNRRKVLKEAFRVLKPGGLIIITMLDPKFSFLWHKLTYFLDTDQRKRGMREGESYGVAKKEVENLLISAGFRNVSYQKFEFGMNTICFAEKI